MQIDHVRKFEGDFFNPMFAADGRLFACVETHSEIHELNILTGESWCFLKGCIAMAISPDSKTLATLNPGKSSELLIYDLESGALTLSCRLPANLIEDIAYSPDGKKLAIGGKHELVFVSASSGDVLKVLPVESLHPVNEVHYFPDGQSILALEYDVAKIRDAATNKLLRQFTLGEIDRLAISPDGLEIAVSFGWTGNDNVVEIWNAESGDKKARLESAGIVSVSYSHDGKLLVGAGGERNDAKGIGVIQVWDPRTGDLILTHRVPTMKSSDTLDTYSTLWDISISPDDKILSTRDGWGVDLWQIER